MRVDSNLARQDCLLIRVDAHRQRAEPSLSDRRRTSGLVRRTRASARLYTSARDRRRPSARRQTHPLFPKEPGTWLYGRSRDSSDRVGAPTPPREGLSAPRPASRPCASRVWRHRAIVTSGAGRRAIGLLTCGALWHRRGRLVARRQ